MSTRWFTEITKESIVSGSIFSGPHVLIGSFDQHCKKDLPMHVRQTSEI